MIFVMGLVDDCDMLIDEWIVMLFKFYGVGSFVVLISCLL